MAGMGFGLSNAAAGGADALTEVLQQKFLEQLQRQKLAEEIRQANMQNVVQHRQLGQGDRRLDQDASQFDARIGLDTKKLGEDTRQFDVTSGQRDRTIQLDEQMQPLRIKHIGAQTADIERRPQAEEAQRAFTLQRDQNQHGFRLGEIGAQGDQARQLADLRAATAPTPNPTAEQSKMAGFANRLEQSDPILSSLEASIVGMNPASFEVQMGIDKPYLQTGPVKQFSQAAKNFINAVLRRESGAVISPEEFATARSQYLPVPGDDETTLRQKRENRAVVLDNLKRSGGPAYQPLSGGGAPAAPAGAQEFIYVPGKGLVPKGGA